MPLKPILVAFAVLSAAAPSAAEVYAGFGKVEVGCVGQGATKQVHPFSLQIDSFYGPSVGTWSFVLPGSETAVTVRVPRTSSTDLFSMQYFNASAAIAVSGRISLRTGKMTGTITMYGIAAPTCVVTGKIKAR